MMKPLLGIVSTVVFASILPAQRALTTLTTALDAGVVANDGATTFDALKASTAITKKATIWAKRQKASAKTQVHLENDLGREDDVTPFHRVMIREDGWAHGKDSKDAFFAHTTNDPRAKGAGTHDFVWFAASKSGAKGKVEIRWHGMSSGASRVGASVDLNGDRRADWNGSVTQGMTSKTFSVVAGARGFAFGIQTFGSAAIRGKTRSSYSGFLTVVFTPAGSTEPPKIECKVEGFGRACGPEMRGEAKLSRGQHYLELITTKIPQNAIGIHVVSSKLVRSPITLPGSKCTLIVEPQYFSFLQQGKGGTALMRIPYRPADGLAWYNQQVWLTFAAKAFVSSSTNGIKLTCSKAPSR
jgi:hypothetical protein